MHAEREAVIAARELVSRGLMPIPVARARYLEWREGAALAGPETTGRFVDFLVARGLIDATTRQQLVLAVAFHVDPEAAAEEAKQTLAVPAVGRAEPSGSQRFRPTPETPPPGATDRRTSGRAAATSLVPSAPPREASASQRLWGAAVAPREPAAAPTPAAPAGSSSQRFPPVAAVPAAVPPPEAVAPPAAEPRAGTRLGRFELLELVGRGGMGVVYRGRDPDGLAVAIKLLRTESGVGVARFDRERRVLGSFGMDDGFVPLLDEGDSELGPFIVMPFVGGGTLESRLEDGPLPIDEAVALGRALAAALGRAHERGIVHRDLKPANILFTEDGQPLVADLGLAKHYRAEDADQTAALTRQGASSGTAGYAAPEQMADAAGAGPPADVFSLGAILFECVAGAPAFEGSSALEVFARVARGSHAPIRDLRPEAPPWLVAVVEACLAVEPSDRFANGAALERALGEGGRRARRRRALRLVGVALAAAALVALGAWWLGLFAATRP